MVTLFLMTEKGFNVLNKIGFEYKDVIHKVVIGNDRNLKKDFESEIIGLCIELGLKYEKRINFKSIETPIAIAIAWRWMIKTEKKSSLIVLHDSILPKYRGFAPLVNSLINKEDEIGVTALFASDDYDCGDIIYQSKSKINYPIKISDAIAINNKNYEACVIYLMNLITNGIKIESYAQENHEATYSVWLDEDDYKIDWSMNSDDILRKINAVGSPYNGATSFLNGKKIKIINVECVDDLIIENRHFGKVLKVQDGFPIVICGSGMLKILEAHYDDEFKNSILPLDKFRSRFG